MLYYGVMTNLKNIIFKVKVWLCSRIGDNQFSGKIPDFIHQNLTNLGILYELYICFSIIWISFSFFLKSPMICIISFWNLTSAKLNWLVCMNMPFLCSKQGFKIQLLFNLPLHVGELLIKEDLKLQLFLLLIKWTY